MAGLKVLAVLPEGGAAAHTPGYVCCVENALGLRPWAERVGATLVVTADKDRPGSELDLHLADTDIIITTPFHPAYLTKARLEAATKLKLAVTAGVGSDHVDLHTAAERGITVAEVTGSNVTSVAEDVVMRLLLLIRNFVPAHEQITSGGWDVPAVASHSWDLENKTVGTLGGGRIGFHIMKRLQGFDVKRMYYARHAKPQLEALGCSRVEDLATFLGQCDLLCINVPLTDETRGMFNRDLLAKMKRGAYIVNNARGAVMDRMAVVEACKSGQLAGYAGDVWDEQPAPHDHPWRTMPHNAMTPHTSGTTLDAQVRYQEGTLAILDAWLAGKPFETDYYIVRDGVLAPQYR